MSAEDHDDYAVKGPFVRFEGRTHFVDPSAGGEHTLCGVAMDAAGSENQPELRWRATASITVTCETCAQVILACRGVAVRVRA